MQKQRLYAPGPVEVPQEILEAIARPTIHHRTQAFQELFLRTRKKLAELTGVPNEDVLILAGSGTSAFEAGFLATVPKGTKVLGINAGKFGERWVKLAQTYGHEVIEYKLEWGEVADPEVLRGLLKQHSDITAVMTTHSETSTGALHDVEALAKVVQKETPAALILVDCVTSLSVSEVQPKAWGLDGVFAGSQKGFMLPPGLGFAWLSERAWSSTKLNPSFYLDLHKERKAQAKGQTAYTPAVNLIYGLEVALDRLLSEGMSKVWQRRASLNQALLESAELLTCKPYAKRSSPAVAALYAPEGIAAPAIVEGFAKRGLRIAGGQDHAKPVLFRPSVLGPHDAFDVITVVSCLEAVLKDLGLEFESGVAVKRALKLLQ